MIFRAKFSFSRRLKESVFRCSIKLTGGRQKNYQKKHIGIEISPRFICKGRRSIASGMEFARCTSQVRARVKFELRVKFESGSVSSVFFFLLLRVCRDQRL